MFQKDYLQCFYSAKWSLNAENKTFQFECAHHSLTFLVDIDKSPNFSEKFCVQLLKRQNYLHKVIYQNNQCSSHYILSCNSNLNKTKGRCWMCIIVSRKLYHGLGCVLGSVIWAWAFLRRKAFEAESEEGINLLLASSLLPPKMFTIQATNTYIFSQMHAFT